MKYLIVFLTFFFLPIGFELLAQQNLYVNSTGYKDTMTITGFRADSLKFSRPFTIVGENDRLLQVIADDSSAKSGHGSDSISFYYMMQMGWQYITLAGVLDTIWSIPTILDTFTMTSAKWYDSKLITGAAPWGRSAIGAPIRVWGQIDTGENASSSSQRFSFETSSATSEQPVQWGMWAPMWRFVFKGLAANKKGSYVRLKLSFTQRQFTPIRGY